MLLKHFAHGHTLVNSIRGIRILILRNSLNGYYTPFVILTVTPQKCSANIHCPGCFANIHCPLGYIIALKWCEFSKETHYLGILF